jgi:hypothetical protein
LGLILVMAALAGGLWSGTGYVTAARQRVEEGKEEERALLRAHASEHEARLSQARSNRSFNQPTTRADAGDFLNPLLPWGSYLNPAVLEALGLGPGFGRRLELTKDLRGALQASWPDSAPPPAALELDTEWLRELADFDHWEFMTSPVAIAYATVFWPREPSYSTLNLWVKADLAQGLALGDLGTRHEHAQHVAWLELTTESRDGLHAALQLLRTAEALAPRWRAGALSARALADAELLVAYRISVLLSCPSGCAGVSTEPLPRPLECTAINEAQREVVMDAWYRAERSPPAEAHEGCRLELARFSVQQEARLPPEDPGPQAWPRGTPMRVGLGALVVHLIRPGLARQLDADLVRHVTFGYSARLSLERQRQP